MNRTYLIVKKFTSLNGICLSDDIIQLIDEKFDNYTEREIQGLLIRINATSVLLKKNISLEFVKEFLSNDIKSSKGWLFTY